MKKINVLIADDHQIVLDGLTMLLQNEDDINIVDVVADGRLALKVLEYEEVDVAVVDISMPGLDGVDTTKAIREKHPATQVLILTMHNEGGYITELIKAGAAGYILKNRGKEELVGAIRKVAAGGQFYSESVTQTLISGIKNGDTNNKHKDDLIQLTRREKEVLKLISRGLTSPQIAEELFIAASTVETHRRNLIDKIGVPNSKALVRYAIKNGYSD